MISNEPKQAKRRVATFLLVLLLQLLLLQYLISREDWCSLHVDRFTQLPPSEHGFDVRRLLTPVILPVSTIYDIFTYASVRLRLAMQTGKRNHAQQLVYIQVQSITH